MPATVGGAGQFRIFKIHHEKKHQDNRFFLELHVAGAAACG
jgi:hypothetical protein